jgi:hypothetical protein
MVMAARGFLESRDHSQDVPLIRRLMP